MISSDYIDLSRLLLILYWIAAISAILLKYISPTLSASLNYGKLTKPSPKRRYLHFIDRPVAHPGVAWPFFYFTGASLTFGVWLGVKQSGAVPSHLLVALCLFASQVARRFLECAFVHHHSDKISVTLLQFLAGTSFYVAAPLSLLASCNLHGDGDHLAYFSVPQILLAVSFMAASYAQNVAHRTLASVTPIIGKYGIPKSFLFRWVVCPHYFAEVVIYTLFALYVPGLQTFFMLIFVACNLTDSAVRTRKWYCATFTRRQLLELSDFAIFPFIL